jgi:PAS domain S-box-containing protein
MSVARAATRTASALRYLATALLLALVYYGAARLGLRYASIGPSVSLVWPPTGLAFASLVLLGYRYWPGVALGAFLANAATPIPLTAAAGIALGNTLEALVACYLLRRRAGDRPQLEDYRHVRALILQAAPGGALVSASIGVASLHAAGVLAAPALPATLAVWWTGDVLGALVVAPVLLSWTIPPRIHEARGILEVAGLCIGTAVAMEVGLLQSLGPPLLQGVEYPYLLFPFVVWAALRFGARGASLMTLTVATMAVWHTVQGAGPFAGATAGRTLFQVGCYLGAVAVTGLALASAVWLERDRATRALQQSEERLRLALDAARMGIWFWSVEGNTLVWDESLRQLFDLAPDEKIASYEHLMERIHPEDRVRVAEAVSSAVENGGPLDCEFRVLLSDGRVRWIADQGKVGRDGSGRAVYMTGICLDVTDRRSGEERLRQAHRMESVGRLAGGVAHETNNQMSVILAASSFILERQDLSDEVKADVEYIRKAAERTSTVTAQLLAFSRRQIMRPEVLDLNTVVSGWEPVLRRIMGEDCAVVLRLAPMPGTVKADRGQLEQVLLNLALNARDAMPRGGILTVETLATELTEAYAGVKPGVVIRPGNYALLVVSDTGQGMSKEIQGHIFEPFFTTKAVGQGTGLGLSTVYGIVKQSDGYIWAYSEPGQGTVFKIYLPLTAEVVRSAQATSPALATARGECILVVEDDAAVREVTRRALQGAGYRVLEAGDGRQALEVLSRANPPVSLVLTDVVMPGMSGRDLAARVAALFPGTPVLFTSGYTDSEIVRRGLLDPGAAFIQKPFTPEVIVRILRERLEAAG